MKRAMNNAYSHMDAIISEFHRMPIKTNNYNEMKQPLLQKWTFVLFITAFFIAGIILAKNILFPLVIAYFLGSLLYPLVWKIERAGIHRVPAILVVLFASIVVIGGILLAVSKIIAGVDIDISVLQQNVNNKLNDLQNWFEAIFGLQGDTLNDFLRRSVNSIFSTWEGKSGGFFSATTTTLFQIGILPVFIFFLLFYRTKHAWFILRIAGRKRRAKTVRILRDISNVATKYMGGVLLVVAVLAVLNTAGLYIIGVSYAPVFGIISALFNLIPYFGTLIGGLVPFLYVFFSYPHPLNTLFQIVILYIIVQFLENNILTPNIVGHNIRINPLAIIFSLLLANMIWGLAGMFVVIPTLAMAKIVMVNTESLQPFAYLISDKGNQKHKVDFKGFYKRIKRGAKHLTGGTKPPKF